MPHTPTYSHIPPISPMPLIILTCHYPSGSSLPFSSTQPRSSFSFLSPCLFLFPFPSFAEKRHAFPSHKDHETQDLYLSLGLLFSWEEVLDDSLLPFIPMPYHAGRIFQSLSLPTCPALRNYLPTPSSCTVRYSPSLLVPCP